MGIVANNSFRFNYRMDLYLLKNYTVTDLLKSWSRIYEYASVDENEDDVYFLADCLDVLLEKTKRLSETDRKTVMEKAKADVEAISIGENVLKLAG